MWLINWRLMEFKPPDIVTVIRAGRLEWLGHVVRMVGERRYRKAYEGKEKKRKT
jgi:hypothetical protein